MHSLHHHFQDKPGQDIPHDISQSDQDTISGHESVPLVAEERFDGQNRPTAEQPTSQGRDDEESGQTSVRPAGPQQRQLTKVDMSQGRVYRCSESLIERSCTYSHSITIAMTIAHV